ncbi:MAG: TerC family protein [Planctomycetes bacterium]|nr:TerC family protein [Planctomycetota bacterium]
MSHQIILWIGFGVLVLGALAIDLGIVHRKAHVVRAREALVWTIVWIVLALSFNVGIYIMKGPRIASEFLAGYLIEKSLSVDNIFVFIVIFSYFGVPAQYESRILMWGILGAFVMRAVFIASGAALLNTFDWMTYVFGAILLFTGFKLLMKREGVVHPERNPLVRLFKAWFGTSDRLDGQRFFTRVGGRLKATPLFIVLLVVETTDVIFAVDSIPAIFAITSDPFIVYTSNVFAILGLRALYFLLARVIGLFRFLKYGLILILWFVGVKMLLAHTYKIPIGWSLATIGVILAVSVLASLIIKKKDGGPGTPTPAEKVDAGRDRS